MRILVTGAHGFIGRHLTRALDQAGHYVVGVDREQGNLLHPGVIEEHLADHKPNVCIHLAAKVGRLFGEDDVAQTVCDNAGMTARVAKACGQAAVRLVYASTSEVYGDQGDTTCSESGRLALPHNAYGLSKRWGEEACLLYAMSGLTIWRISMPYGPGLPAGRGRAAIVNMLAQAKARQTIPVHRGAERSWCWVGDTVQAMLLTLDHPEGGVWNIGRDDNPTSMVNVAELACDLTGAPLDLIELVDAPARQTVVKRLATDRIRSLGWHPTVELEEGMRRTLSWLEQEVEVTAAPHDSNGTLNARKEYASG